jgi:hypothetical protein
MQALVLINRTRPGESATAFASTTAAVSASTWSHARSAGVLVQWCELCKQQTPFQAADPLVATLARGSCPGRDTLRVMLIWTQSQQRASATSAVSQSHNASQPASQATLASDVRSSSRQLRHRVRLVRAGRYWSSPTLLLSVPDRAMDEVAGMVTTTRLQARFRIKCTLPASTGSSETASIQWPDGELIKHTPPRLPPLLGPPRLSIRHAGQHDSRDQPCRTYDKQLTASTTAPCGTIAPPRTNTHSRA